MMKKMTYLMLLVPVFSWHCSSPQKDYNDETVATVEEKIVWKELFNGKDLSDWKVKISKHELGDNFANTFRRWLIKGEV